MAYVPMQSTLTGKVHLGELTVGDRMRTVCGRRMSVLVGGPTYPKDSWGRLPDTIKCESCDRSEGNRQ